MLVETARVSVVAALRAACFRGDAQIAGIHELDVLRRFFEPECVRAFRRVRSILEDGVARLHVRFFLGRIVRCGIRHGSGNNGNGGVASVAIGAPERNRFCRMHRWLVRRCMTRHASGGFVIRCLLGLAAGKCGFLRGSRCGFRTRKNTAEQKQHRDAEYTEFPQRKATDLLRLMHV